MLLERPTTSTDDQVAPSAAGPAARYPGLALSIVCVGFLLWWVIGVSNFIAFPAAAWMAIDLARLRRITTPRRFGVWLLFLAIVVVGVVLLQVAAPGANPEHSSSRYITWTFRLAWYLTATVTLLYIGNFREQLTTTRVCRIFGWMFVAVVAGGWLGALFPHLNFPSLVELVLPRGLRTNEFVSSLVHPQLAQVNPDAPIQTPRPSAPTPYANVWGLNYAAFAPFFVYGWLRKDAGWYRPVGMVILLLSVFPVVHSLNRGLWLTLILCVLVVAVRAAARGNVKPLLVGVLAAGLLVVVVAPTPLGSLVMSRLQTQTESADTRSNLGLATVESVAEGSPVIGFGTTRNVQGTFGSIAGGATAECPLCSPPALGTQGHVWLVIFGQGILGLFLYLTFHAWFTIRALTLRSPGATVGLVVLVVHFLTMAIYDTIGTAQIAFAAAIALIWRDHVDVAGARHASGWTLGRYYQLPLRHLGPTIVLVALGATIPAVALQAQRSASLGGVSVYLPMEPRSITVEVDKNITSMDTEGAFALAPSVVGAMAAAVGHQLSPDDVFISAEPNSRVLNLSVVGPNVVRTKAALAAGARQVLAERRLRLDATRLRAVDILTQRRDGAAHSYAQVAGTLDFTDRNDAVMEPMLTAARNNRSAQAAKLANLDAWLETISDAKPIAGQVVVAPWVRPHRDTLTIGVSSGLVIGLLAASVVALLLERRTVRLSARRPWGREPLRGLPVREYGSSAIRIWQALGASFISADGRTPSARRATELSGHSAIGSAAPVPLLVLVVQKQSRVRDVVAGRDRARSWGCHVLGLVVIPDEHPAAEHLERSLTQPLMHRQGRRWK